jgi:lambda repressor-like predicted transcriptional regulator
MKFKSFESLGDYIRKEIKKQGLNITRVSRRLGLSRFELTRALCSQEIKPVRYYERVLNLLGYDIKIDDFIQIKEVK